MIFNVICEKKIRQDQQLLRAPCVGKIRRVLIREEHAEFLLAIKMTIKIKARAAVEGTGEKGPLCDPGSESLLGGSARRAATHGMNKK